MGTLVPGLAGSQGALETGGLDGEAQLCADVLATGALAIAAALGMGAINLKMRVGETEFCVFKTFSTSVTSATHPFKFVGFLSRRPG